MQRSIDRILTTHAGIPRGEALGTLLIDQELGKPVDRARLDELTDARVAHVLNKEAEVGIDSANDGEQGRVGFQTYIPQRMDGFWRRVEAAVRQGVHRVFAVHPADDGAHPEDEQSVRRPAGDRRVVSRHRRSTRRSGAIRNCRHR